MRPFLVFKREAKIVGVGHMKQKKDVVKTAKDYCAAENLRWTPPREMVLDILAQTDKPMGAYDIIDAMAEHRDRPKPPTAYRAIDFWCEHGFLHKIDSLNAYILCHAEHRHHGSQFLICTSCGGVTEAHICHLPKSMQEKADNTGFKTENWTMEIRGLCEACQ